MKQTALTQLHKDLGAKMAEFAGYEMPIVYSGQVEEHHTGRAACFYALAPAIEQTGAQIGSAPVQGQ